MKKILLAICLIFSSLIGFAVQGYSERFIKSFSACEPVTEHSIIKDEKGNSIPLTKMVQGVLDHKCMYKQVIIRSSARDITTCAFTKPMLEEISNSMKEDNGEVFNVELTINGENIRLNGLTKSQIIWTQYLNADAVCRREILSR